MEQRQDFLSYSTDMKKRHFEERRSGQKNNIRPAQLNDNQFRQRVQNRQQQLAQSLSMFQKNKVQDSAKKKSNGPKLEMAGPSAGMRSRWDRVAIRSSSSSVSRHQFNNMAVSPIQRTQAKSPLKATQQNQTMKGKVDSKAIMAFQKRQSSGASNTPKSGSAMDKVMASRASRPQEQRAQSM